MAGMLPWLMVVQEDAGGWPQRFHPGLGPCGESQVTFEIMKSILLTRYVIFLEVQFLKILPHPQAFWQNKYKVKAFKDRLLR